MNQIKLVRVGLGVVVVCLLLSIVLLPWAVGREAVLASSTGGDKDEVYLPLVMRLLSPLATSTLTPTNTPSATSAPTFTPSATQTPTPTFTPTNTSTSTFTPTNTPSATSTPTFTPWATQTPTPTFTPTNTSTPTFTPTPTCTPLPTFTPTPTATSTFITSRVSIASDGTQGNDGSWTPSISADGRYIAFNSDASNLVSCDTNSAKDIFIHDRQTAQTSRVSIASDGTQGNNDSWTPSISADGRYIAFTSDASNLVSGDTNSSRDIFVYDQQTGQTRRVSIASDGTEGNYPSGYYPSISADGRYVAFKSSASNLVNNDTDGWDDIFVHDQQTGQTSRVSIASDGTQGNSSSTRASISADGRYVAFDSYANNLVSGDTNNRFDLFVHDRQTGETSRISIASDGTQGNGSSEYPSISADGRYVAFNSSATNLVNGDTNGLLDVFVHDRQTGQTSRVSVASDGTQGNDHTSWPTISADGRYVAFTSGASNLVSGDTNLSRDVFVHDRQTGQTSRISIASDGTQGNDISWRPSISADGRYVAFDSLATNLVNNDTNGFFDVFVHDRAE